MRKFILGCLGVAAAAFALQTNQAEIKAGVFDECSPCAEISECNPCDDVAACDPCEPACGKKSKWFFNGHVESGIWANEFGQKSGYTGGRHGGFDSDSGNTAILQNVQHTGYQLNQAYFSAGRSVDGSHGWDFGGTADFTFGTDARYVQSAGFERANGHDATGWGSGDYYSAFAQAYFEAAYKKWNIKAGKFYAPFGSQVYKGSDSFFYSYAPTYGFVPATAGGAYATYSATSKLAVYGGWVQPDEFGETSDDNAMLGGVIYQASKKLNLHYAFAFGKDTRGNTRATDVDYFVNSLVATYQINKKWKYVFDFSLKNAEIGDSPNNDVHALNYGFNNELIYQYSKKLAFGARYAYVRDKGFRYPLYWNSDSYLHSISLGANWTPAKWLVVKPELRYDVTNDGSAFNWASGGKTSDHQLSGGFSTVVKF